MLCLLCGMQGEGSGVLQIVSDGLQSRVEGLFGLSVVALQL